MQRGSGRSEPSPDTSRPERTSRRSPLGAGGLPDRPLPPDRGRSLAPHPLLDGVERRVGLGPKRHARSCLRCRVVCRTAPSEPSPDPDRSEARGSRLDVEPAARRGDRNVSSWRTHAGRCRGRRLWHALPPDPEAGPDGARVPFPPPVSRRSGSHRGSTCERSARPAADAVSAGLVGTLCYAARRPGGVAQPGRALPSHGRGQGFKSPHLHVLDS